MIAWAFGPWQALDDDLPRVATPVGEPCTDCGDPIEADDQGFIRIAVDAHRARQVIVHAGCELARIIGHEYEVCACFGYDVSAGRAAGDELWRRLAPGP